MTLPKSISGLDAVTGRTPSILSHLLLLILLCCATLFPRLGGARLWDRDEPRNAGCAVEMMQRGDWVVPWFNNELRVHKPVLVYWFMMGSYALFGVSEFTARLPSALFGVGTTILTYLIGRRLFDATVGLWAGAIVSTSVLFVAIARMATPDSTLMFFETLATLAFVYGAFPDDGSRRYFPRGWTLAALMYASMGVAALAKGPVAFVLPTAVIGMFLLIVRLPDRHPEPTPLSGRRAWASAFAEALRPFAPRHFARVLWSMRPLTAIMVILAVAAPWYALVGQRTHGAWLHGFFVTHNIDRALKPMEGNGGGPWFYPAIILAGFFPWTILLSAAAVSTFAWIRRRDALRPAYLFVACWIIVYLVIFSVPKTKLPAYAVPMFPAIALLTAAYLVRWAKRDAVPDPLRPAVTFGTLSLVSLALAIGVAIGLPHLLGGGAWIGGVALVPALGAIACLFYASRERRTAAAVALYATSLLFCLGLFAVCVPAVDRFQQSDRLLAAIRANSPTPNVASFGRLEPSWVFYLRKPIFEFPKESIADAAAFLANDPSAYLITTPERFTALGPALTPVIVELARIPYFGRAGELIVVGRRGADAPR